jgi:hypothetical protein
LVGLLLVLLAIVGLIIPSPLYLSWPLMVGTGLVVCFVATIRDRGRMFALIGLAIGVLFLSTFLLARFTS